MIAMDSDMTGTHRLTNMGNFLHARWACEFACCTRQELIDILYTFYLCFSLSVQIQLHSYTVHFWCRVKISSLGAPLLKATAPQLCHRGNRDVLSTGLFMVTWRLNCEVSKVHANSLTRTAGEWDLKTCFLPFLLLLNSFSCMWNKASRGLSKEETVDERTK